MSNEEKHLCWSCAKAFDYSCPAYEGLQEIVEENFESIKIYFQIQACNFYKPDK